MAFSIVSMPSTMQASAEMRRIVVMCADRGKDLLTLSDAQEMIHAIYPTAYTRITVYTKTKDADGQGLVL